MKKSLGIFEPVKENLYLIPKPVKQLNDERIAEIEMLCSDMDEHGHSKLDSLAFANAIIKEITE